jgi:hypothetical protein
MKTIMKINQDNYDIAASNLLTAADYAIESFKRFLPKHFDENQTKQFINSYEMFKNIIINAKPEFKTMASLKFDIENIFTYFQEGSGDTVEYFWKKINENNLPYRRENKMVKILKRGKINNAIEYDFAVDVIVPYQQEGIITKEEAKIISHMIGVFESKKK